MAARLLCSAVISKSCSSSVSLEVPTAGIQRRRLSLLLDSLSFSSFSLLLARHHRYECTAAARHTQHLRACCTMREGVSCTLSMYAHAPHAASTRSPSARRTAHWCSLTISVCIRSLYAQSYCSALWNRLVNRRLRRLGPRPVPGDLVLLATHGGGRLGRKQQVAAFLDQRERSPVRPRPARAKSSEACLTPGASRT
jgi:hypothetical protein